MVNRFEVCYLYIIKQSKTMTHADIIAQQIGGRKFQAMTGASFMSSNNGQTLVVKFKMCQKANIWTISYNQGSDLYDVEFTKWTGKNIKPVSQVSGVYADQLCPIFESTTGLRTSL